MSYFLTTLKPICSKTKKAVFLKILHAVVGIILCGLTTKWVLPGA